MDDNQANRQTDTEGDGNVVGDRSQSRVIKAEIAGPVSGQVAVGERIVQKIVQVFTGDTDAERARRARRNRQAMLQRVRHDWIEGVLDQSLYHVARIELEIVEDSDAVQHPWDVIVQQPERPSRCLPPGTRVNEIFDELEGALLILGAPGTGKTTLLLELASDLIDRAERDPDHLIPVVFNLSSWAVRRCSLVDWLVDELNQRYSVPHKIAQVWVKEEQILPLLDGLDEVPLEHREECVRAINEFCKEHGLLPLVVCSRVADYEALTVRLSLRGALLIRPLTQAQVDAYLACQFKHVRGRIRIFAPGGGFVFNQIHNIQTNVPPENIVAMLDAAYEFGTYPIS